MKKLMILIVAVCVLSVFGENQYEDKLAPYIKKIEAKLVELGSMEPDAPNYLIPQRPADFPVVNCDGDTITWDWKYQVAYNEKRLFTQFSEEGCVTAVILSKAKQ
ncbi:hypothetical protein ACFLR1_04035 [Bacteroidota bacterium]